MPESKKLSAGIIGSEDGTVKTESISGAVTAIVHTMTGSIGGGAGVLASGNVPSDASFIKLPTGEAGGHIADLQPD